MQLYFLRGNSVQKFRIQSEKFVNSPKSPKSVKEQKIHELINICLPILKNF
jgi:hypothetical protein